jgi:hypothetical protein
VSSGIKERSRVRALLRSGVWAVNDLVGRLDIHSGPHTPTASAQHPPLRIALVKPEGVNDLYRYTAKPSAASAILTSPQRSGPVGLLTRFNTDWWIARNTSDPAMQVWTERRFCNVRMWSDETAASGFARRPFVDPGSGRTTTQHDIAVDIDEIPWQAYDVVIAYDAVVPPRITSRFPGVLWCYYICEPGMPSFRRSLFAALPGYDLFLNQRFRKHRLFFPNARHVIDFPYHLQYYPCFTDAGFAGPTSRSGTALECTAAEDFRSESMRVLEAFGPVRRPFGGIDRVLQALTASKYWVKVGPLPRWGNGMIEAIAAGCLAIGDPRLQFHSSLFTQRTVAHSLEDVRLLLDYYESDDDAYFREVELQRSLVNNFCFDRPLSELVEKGSQILDARRQPPLCRGEERGCKEGEK